MKKCILYDDKICNDCGECMRCDLDPNKICDNCGKCLKTNTNDEFLNLYVRAEDMHVEDSSDDRDDEELTEEEKAFNEFLDAPIDLQLPEPLEVDPELAAQWEAILRKYEEEELKEDVIERPDLSQDEQASAHKEAE